MVNMGAKILEEGKAMRASDIDVVWVNGYGWPVYHGGPMFWAEGMGPGYRRRQDQRVRRPKLGGEHWELSPLLANGSPPEGKTFQDLAPQKIR